MSNGLSCAEFVIGITIVVSVLIMILFAHPIGNFFNQHPSLQVLGLSFLLLIGFMLLADSPLFAYTNIGAASGFNPQRISLFRYSFFVWGGIYKYEAKGK